MNESYLTSKFEQFERDNCWDELFHKINVESDEQEQQLGLSYDVSNCFDNMEKNRYRNVLPYDQNRVTLRENCEAKTDYINASPLSIPGARRNYILTQGPLSTTADDFWQMVYEQDSRIVIMLSKIMEKNFIKCHSYFPDKSEPVAKFDFFTCELLNEEEKRHYVLRTIRLSPLTQSTSDDSASSKDVGRVIHHFQFITWPDFGVPEHTDHFLEFLEHVRQTYQKLEAERNSASTEGSDNAPPIVCHCSAGIGRTGTFVIVDSVLCMLETKDLNCAASATEPEAIENNCKSESVQNISNDDKPAAGDSNDVSSEVKSAKANKRKKANLGIVEVKPNSSLMEPLDKLSDLVVFIRRYRMGLIQTPQQLRFCWRSIVDWIKNNRTSTESAQSATKKMKSDENSNDGTPGNNTSSTSLSSPNTSGNINSDSVQFRKERVQRMRDRLRDVECRRNMPLLKRLLHRSVLGNSENGIHYALLVGGSATVILISVIYYFYCNGGVKADAASGPYHSDI
ncbi:protein-tyrosine phosphatase domain-containing protein [Ditylenchus destructor]|uniref:protein-tyrosine-phosphatase n=1 Tax=Ditylenchus destructor TaxID=166010 RepID=A0AAD4MUA9_9BILA|nr:protein-tyrosine phosphatase domain-containing protein [Ditylenchus destructor]